MNKIVLTTTLCLLAGFLGPSAVPSYGQTGVEDPLRPEEIAVSKPSLRLQLHFAAPGIVQEWMVNPGDRVTVGQRIMTQDSRLLSKNIEKLELQSQSEHQIDAARAQLDVSKVLLERKLESADAFSKSELEEAKLQVDIGEIRVKLAEQEKRSAGIEVESAKIQLGLMDLKSPVDGQVVSLNVGPGEMADPNNAEGVAEVVQNSPLWVELVLPLKQASLLQVGDQLVCKHGDGVKAEGKVIYFSPVAQADTQLVRLELPNSELRPSGMPVRVSLPTEPSGSAGTK